MHILFKCTRNILQDHMLGCKAWLDKFKTIEITSSIFCNNNAVRLEVKYKKKLKKKKKPQNINAWRLSNMLNNQWITEEIKAEKKKQNLDTTESKNMMIQNLWDAAKALLRGNFTAI